MKLMIVESPNKVEKIGHILGDDWKVMASYGHIRDLPAKALGLSLPDLSLEYDFLPPTTVGNRTFPGSEMRVNKLRHEAAHADMVFLATDPDREGEAISWHLKEALGLADRDYQRVTFTEITHKAIHDAVSVPRKIDDALVRAQEGRRALDRIVGYLVSPVLSQVLGMGLSAGRVQSIAVRLVVDLERRIRAFKPTKHFGASVSFDKGAWSATWDTKAFVSEQDPCVLDEALAQRAAACRQFRVMESSSEDASERPPSPLSTSLMLRAASVALKMSAAATTKAAQKLFEDGHITYIRTDSVNLSEEAVIAVRGYAQQQGWELPAQPRRFKEKASAQGGHADAIRPTHVEVESAGADDTQRALYKLIRERTIASQLADARYRVNTVRLQAIDADLPYEFTAKGRVLTGKGWRVLSTDAAEDADESQEGEGEAGRVPVLSQNAHQAAEAGQVQRKTTQPPRRYSESSLIKKLEDEGIGRPSTYAAIMGNIMGRAYVAEEKRYLVPTEIGEMVVDNLVRANFSFMEVPFTRDLEVELDAIAEGRTSYMAVVRPAYNQLQGELATVGSSGVFKPRFTCPKCDAGLRRYAKPGKTPFWRCTEADTCGHYMDDDKGKPVERASHPCPECGGAMRRFKRRSGAGYVWSCSVETCNCMLDDHNGKPLGQHACPKCSAPLRRYQKRDKETGKAKGGHGWFCTAEACKTFLDDEKGKPIEIKAVPCPSCNKPMYRRKGQYGFFWGCSGFKDGCKQLMDDKDGKPVPKAARRATAAPPRRAMK